MTKASAVAKYSKLVAAESTREEVMAALSEDEKAYSADDINEIMEALYAPAAPAPDAAPLAAPSEEADPSAILKFEKHTAKPVFKFRSNEDTGAQERYLHSVEKTSSQPLSTHNMEQRHADELNGQLENSGFYYFPVKK